MHLRTKSLFLLATFFMAIPTPGFAGPDCTHPDAAITFDPSRDYQTGPLPVAIAVGDFDGDHLPDFAIGCDIAVLTVHHNRGSGVFDEPRFIQASGYGTQGVAAGDLDADGKDELVAASWLVGANHVVVYHGGANGFTAEEEYELPDQPTSVAIGDMNGDGLPDLVVTGAPDPLDLSSGSRVWFFRNLGKALFERAIPVAVGKIPRSVVLADFDSDGRLDFAVANYGLDDHSLSVGLNRGFFQFEIATIPLGIEPAAIAAGNLNGDGNPDLVAVGSDYLTGDRARPLLNLGNGTFAPGHDLSIGQNAEAVAIGDLDGDAANDLVVGNVTGAMISVFPGYANGTFGPRADWAYDDDPHAIALADLNLDGALDLIATRWFSDGVSVWPNATTLLARVDLKVGNNGNRLSDHSSGRVSIGILGSEHIDVHAIDLESIEVGGSPVSAHLNGRSEPRFARLDGDQYDDVVLFASAASVTSSRDGCVLVSGRLGNGRHFQGGDSIRLIGSPNELNGEDASAGPQLALISSSRGELRLALHVVGPADAQVDVFNVRGARVAGDRARPGSQQLTLRGAALGPGVYLVRLSSSSGVSSLKVTIVPN